MLGKGEQGELGNRVSDRQGVEIFDRFPKAVMFNRHCHIDGVEIFFATKATGQIGFRIGCGDELGADGTQEAKVSIGDFGWNFEDIGDQS